MATISPKFQALLADVRKRHPFLHGTGLPDAGVTVDSSHLWDRLASCEPDRIASFCGSLSTRDERVMALTSPGHLDNPNLVELIQHLAQGRATRRWAEVAAILHMQELGGGNFAALAKEYFSSLKPPADPSIVGFAGSAEPLKRLRDAYACSQVALEALWCLPKEERWKPAREAGMKALMLRDEVDPVGLVVREGTETVLRWFRAVLAEDERHSWLLRYLNTDPAAWEPQDPWLRFIVKAYGQPRPHAPFYKDLPAGLLEALRRWQLGGELAKHLGDERRVAFWKGYLQEIRNIEVCKDGGALFIAFDSWFAVQFRAMGKATYMFPGGFLITMRRLHAQNLYRRVLDLRHKSLGMYKHQGAYWDAEARRVVDDVLRTAGSK